MILVITDDTILNCIDYEDMIQDIHPKLDTSITDKAMKKQRRIAPIKPINAVIKRQPCKNTQFRRR